MSAPFRIQKPAYKGIVDQDEDGLKPYLERLFKMIPAEVISLYLVGNGVIPKDKGIISVIWVFICLIGVVVVRRYGTADQAQNLKPDWIHIGISSVAFLIWAYSLGGPFTYYNLYIPYLGSLLILAFTFFIPFLYKGPKD